MIVPDRHFVQVRGRDQRFQAGVRTCRICKTKVAQDAHYCQVRDYRPHAWPLHMSCRTVRFITGSVRCAANALMICALTVAGSHQQTNGRRAYRLYGAMRSDCGRQANDCGGSQG